MELDNTYLSRGEVNGSEKWKQGKNTAALRLEASDRGGNCHISILKFQSL